MRAQVLLRGVPMALLALAGAMPTFAQKPKDNGAPHPLAAPFGEAAAKKARAEWAKHLKVPETKSIELSKDVKLDLVLIPPGKFKMGSPKGVGFQNEVQHEVEITRAFYMGKYEVTQGQYDAVVGEAASNHLMGKPGPKKADDKDTSKFPVEQVQWKDAVGFCEKSKVKGMSLPSEAQWEYACRAGADTKYHFGDEIAPRDANFVEGKRGGGVPVGSYAANGFGLYDTHGNVWEWCRDGYLAQYEKLNPKDPIEEKNKSRRVLRGGSWGTDAAGCRAASRINLGPAFLTDGCGFRVIVTP